MDRHLVTYSFEESVEGSAGLWVVSCTREGCRLARWVSGRG